MSTEPLERKLAAILYADVAGYSRLTGEDEEGTHRRLRTYLDAITGSIEKHGGTVMHFAGDAVLADFASVVDALICALNIQRELAIRNERLRDTRKLQFRIGINLGDVIVDRNEIYGDGVNVAARLEGLAEPGGICISGTVFDALGTKLPVDYEYLGEQHVKNIDRPVRTYRARLKAGGLLPEPSLRSRSWRQGKRLIGTIAVGALLTIGAGALIWWITSPSTPEPTREQGTRPADMQPRAGMPGATDRVRGPRMGETPTAQEDDKKERSGEQ
jgi:adenylate cyclase